MQRYRNDIDGLRGLAVGAVVLYHCGFIRFFPGGFVGVDVFFVLSGFLITGLVLSDIAKSSFSLIDFYNRRVRRIFPALFVVYAFVLVASFLLMMPNEIKATSENVISSILFVSNIFFYTQAGYFDSAGENNLVLHTWSLSVEEQFYVFLPVAAFCATRLRPVYRNSIFFGTFMSSLIASVYMVDADQSAAFYLLQYRAWELIFGSLLVMGVVPSVRNAMVANVVAVVGLVAVLGSVFFLNNQFAFPGLWAIPAVVGTGMILHANAQVQTFIGGCLGLTPLRFVGLVSYSFYLWHWPIWVLARQIHEPTGPFDRLFIVAVAFAFAVASWWFVERPFRQQPYRTAPKRVLMRSVAVTSVGLAAFALLVPVANSYWRVPPRIAEIADFASTYNPRPSLRTDVCFLTAASNNISYFNKGLCLQMTIAKENVVLLGDSHAAHFYPGLSSDKQINVLQATASGCKPIVGSLGEVRCTELIDYMVDEFLPKHHVDVIVIGGRWAKSDIPGLLLLLDKVKLNAGRVVVMGPIVEYDIPLPRVLAKSLYANDPAIVASHRRADTVSVDHAMAEALRGTGVTYVSTYDILCPNVACRTESPDGKPIQFDYGHLTADGAKWVIQNALQDILRVSPAKGTSL